ncbi:MAG TPA: bifunctional hydroxymethylpyrimidine kinase/phosphomethylpyrimidine kinase [Humidesulfovibrio sp.]|uniref:bifunctional hydroxymethylpyrimidine kinase/phosphomethylpyrimidine kinase n=1 Tax=Humidesulfovibrio sp. TaxID=2910988 RepID=UPI002C815427|nr:bifunctional hydroxymethylpyrimidine kinase/phosphomethylpyrimidine kinase [Humidesulfovibrio sp.]HWR03403.1 bifunctional hydroxymethylpyrimidine kinase/phosphomethylpyrimidine kinase [Humidesulfovibrio sp.]
MYDNPTVLTIAGSDSGGGAGIQADLKTIAMLGGFGASVITALTAQNTMAVTGIHPVPPDFVVQQLTAVLSDLRVRAVKTGMLFSGEIIRAVAAGLANRDFPLVVDPVCVAQSGARLLEESAVTEMVRHLFPITDLLTPNIPEAELFTGLTLKSAQDICEAAERLLAMGPKAVLIKGGHMDSPASTDWYVTPGQKPLPLMQSRVDTKNLHGTGCTLSAAIAAHLGLGHDMLTSVRKAQLYLHAALRSSYSVGKGGGSPNHAVPLLKERARLGTLDELAETGRLLSQLPRFAKLIPEVRSNLVLALPYASTAQDIAAFSGRITCTRRGEVILAGGPEFGASSHMARVLLAARKFNPRLTCSLNIACNDETLAALKRTGMTCASFDRALEPADGLGREGGTMDWGTQAALEASSTPRNTDAVVDMGGMGKEPMIRLMALDTKELMVKVRRILDLL